MPTSSHDMLVKLATDYLADDTTAAFGDAARKDKDAKTIKNVETAYNEHSKNIAKVLKDLDGVLKAHEKKHKAAPMDWGYAGDLEEVEGRLKTALNFLKNEE